jgi:hypothetical protein
MKSYKHVLIRSVNLGRQHFTRHGLHINYKGKKEICHQIADLVQRKLGVGVNICPVVPIPLQHKEDTVHDETIPLEYKEDTVHEGATKIQGNEAEETLAHPSLKCVVLAEKDQHREVCMSTRKRKPPVKISEDFL